MFELRVTTVGETINNVGGEKPSSSTRVIGYDTTSVYVIKLTDTTLTEFSNFARTNKIIDSRSIFEKKGGFGYHRLDKPWVYNGNPVITKDSTIGQVRHYYVDTLIKNDRGQDSARGRTVMVKMPHFISPLLINNVHYTDDAYTIIGYCAYSYKEKQGMYTQIDSLRPFTRAEQKICEAMVKQVPKKK